MADTTGDLLERARAGDSNALEQLIDRHVPLLRRWASGRLPGVLEAVRRAHSYEEPAIDVYPTIVRDEGVGVGRVGRLPGPTTLAADLNSTSTEGMWRFTGSPTCTRAM